MSILSKLMPRPTRRSLVAFVKRRTFVHRTAWPVVGSLIGGLSFVLVNGPSLQTYVVALARLEKGSIYQAVNNDSLVMLPSLESWVLAGFDCMFLALAAGIVLFGLRSVSTRQLFLTLSASSLAVLTTFDAAGSIWDEEATWMGFAQNVACNAVGGVAIAAWTILVLGCCDVLLRKLRGGRALRVLLAVSLPLAAGLVTSVALYLVVKLFLNTVPMKLDVTLGPESTGTIAPSVRLASDRSDGPVFDLPLSRANARLTWTSPVHSLAASWKHPGKGRVFNVTVALFEGCAEGQKLPATLPRQLHWEDVHSFDMGFDQGGSFFSSHVIGFDGRNAVLKADDVRQFWIKKANEASEAPSITQFVNGASLSYSGGISGVGIDLSAIFFDVKSGATAPRTLSFRVDGTEHIYPFAKPLVTTRVAREQMRCTPIAAKGISTTADIPVRTSPGVVAVRAVASITPRADDALALEGAGRVTVRGDDGWIAQSGVSLLETSLRNGGRVGFLIFRDAVSVRVDGRPYDVPAHDPVSVIGRLEGRFENSGRLRFVGEGRYVYLGVVRVNRTQWERLGLPYRALLGSIALAIGGLLLRALKGWLGEDVAYEFLRRPLPR